jgi:hypothetical protein
MPFFQPSAGWLLVRRWLRRVPGVMFVVCLAVAGGLVALVAAAPYVAGGDPPAADVAGRALALFARDATVRRTALASAVGLVATAFVFFRPPYGRPPRAPTDVIGA